MKPVHRSLCPALCPPLGTCVQVQSPSCMPHCSPKSGHPQTQIRPQQLLGYDLTGVAHDVRGRLSVLLWSLSHAKLLGVLYTFTLFSVPRSHRPLCLDRRPPPVPQYASLGRLPPLETFQNSPHLPFSQI